MLGVCLPPSKFRRRWMWSNCHCQAVGIKTATNWQAHGTRDAGCSPGWTLCQTCYCQCHGDRHHLHQPSMAVPLKCPHGQNHQEVLEVSSRCSKWFCHIPGEARLRYPPPTKVKLDFGCKSCKTRFFLIN